MERSRMTDGRGLSMVESTVLLGVMVGLAAVFSPVARSTIERARRERAQTDARTLERAVDTMLTDTGETYVLKRGHGAAITDAPDRSRANRVHMLVTAGEAPAIDAAVVRSEGTDWTDAVDDDRVSRFAVHLVTNAAGYRSPAQMTGLGQLAPADSRLTSSLSRGTGWRGSYLAREIGPDPWGRRYAANVERAEDVVVLSAGRDGRVDTSFSAGPQGRRGDDIVVTASDPPRGQSRDP